VPVLHLLRHAKSSWDDPALADRERPLAPRGERAATLVGTHLAREGVRPDLVLCSPARRAVETLERLRAAGAPLPAAELEEGLYGATAGELAERLRRLPAELASALLVGHNPGLHDLAGVLAGSGPSEDLRRLRRKLPTAGWVELALPGDAWGAALEPGAAALRRFRAPRDLA